MCKTTSFNDSFHDCPLNLQSSNNSDILIVAHNPQINLFSNLIKILLPSNLYGA